MRAAHRAGALWTVLWIGAATSALAQVEEVDPVDANDDDDPADALDGEEPGTPDGRHGPRDDPDADDGDVREAPPPAAEGEVDDSRTPAQREADVAIDELDPALRAAIERLVERQVDERVEAAVEARVAPVEAKAQEAVDAAYSASSSSLPPLRFELKGDFFTKWLFRNNQSGGCVSYGNPAPEGDNFSGDNGICSELSISMKGFVSDRVEVGARLASRYGAQWASWWENGDLKSTGLDGSGESLGMNHAAYIQLRGLYLRAAPPIPTVTSIHLGASDLSQFNAWTIGKIRYTERDNARGIFIDGELGGPWLSYTFARVALPKLWASAGYNTGIDDPLVQNPFWERDAAYAYKLQSEWDWFRVEHITSGVLDEEADLDDPDALGSTNTIDGKDGVVITNPRYVNINSTVEASSDYLDFLSVKALVGYSLSWANEEHVFNSVSGSQGFSPVPMGFHPFGYAATARIDFFADPLADLIVEDLMGSEMPFDTELELHFEYFNISSEWVSVMGARRETDVLLTDGFLEGGQTPTLNVANEFQDFTEPFYESIIGWHGATGLLKWSPWSFVFSGEATFIEYNTDTGDTARDVDEVYPDFLYTDGMTDTELYSYANTNDRGRDPRSVYHRHQNRRTVIGVLKGSYTLDLSSWFEGDWTDYTPPLTFRVKHKTIWDVDLRDLTIDGADDYNGLLFFNRISAETPITDELSLSLGYQLDYWNEAHRSGDVVAGVANYPDYQTLRQKAFFDLRYVWGGMSLWYHLEYLNKDVFTTDPRLDAHYRSIVRSIAMVTASF